MKGPDGANIQARDVTNAFQLFLGCILCNDAVLDQVDNKWIVKGDPTEGALIVAAVKGGLRRRNARVNYERQEEVPFSSERKRMSTIHSLPEGGRISFTKGAPEVIIDRCTHIMVNGTVQPMTHEQRMRILAANESMANDALRVLAFAKRDLTTTDPITEDALNRTLSFLD